jgi:hypothetical protein
VVASATTTATCDNQVLDIHVLSRRERPSVVEDVDSVQLATRIRISDFVAATGFSDDAFAAAHTVHILGNTGTLSATHATTKLPVSLNV